MTHTLTFFEARFETASEIFPPYCHYYHLILEQQEEKLLAEFTQKYHHREELTAEEIEEEGFSNADDYAWKGEPTAALTTSIFEKLLNARLLPEKELPDTENYLFLHFRSTGREGEGVPQKKEDWEYFLQEIIQGIYELAGKEAPLHLELLRNEQNLSAKTSCTIRFSERNAEIAYTENQVLVSQKTITDWPLLQELMNTVFSQDFDPDRAVETEPSGSGTYLNPGDNRWHKTGKELRKIFQSLL